jgi:putative ABC transport system permease protein
VTLAGETFEDVERLHAWEEPLRFPLWRRRRNRELDEEIEAHLRLAVADRVARGEPRESAEAAARRELGNVGLVKEVTREQWGWASVERFGQDVRYGARLLRHAPGFAAVAIATLALAIGANTAILSVVHSILLRPLGYADPGRLVVLLHQGRNPVAPGNFLDWRARSRSFEAMGAAEYWTPNLLGGDSPTKLWALRLTPEILPILGVRPALGRFFLPSETADGHVAVIGHGLWQRRFGSDPAVVGKTISLDGEPYTIVGVMPPSFHFAPFWATQAELWAPLDLAPRAASRTASSLRVFARLRQGVSIAQARAEVAAITATLEREFPGTNRDVQVMALQEKVVGNVRPVLLVLVGAVALVLLLACANVANMLLARASARQKEMALRTAIGASRGRTIRQLVTESLVLAAAGGVAGVALGAWGLRALLALAPAETPRLADVRLDPRILLATFALSLVTGVAFGLAPALQGSATSGRLQDALKEGGSAGTRRAMGLLRGLFVGAEVAIALVLLVGAGLMVRSFLALQTIDPGFDPRGVVALEVSVAGTGQAEPGRRAVLYPQILERIAGLPGVRAAGAINHLPIAGDIWGWPYRIEGRPTPRPGESPVAAYRAVMPGYFAAMRLPILRGRDVAPSDTASAPGVVLVNEFLANRVWPGEDPIGKRLSFDGSDEDPAWVTVIGVVKNGVREEWREEPDDEIFLAALQRKGLVESAKPQEAYLTFVARTDGDPATLAPSLRSAIWALDRTLPISEVQTMESVAFRATGSARFQTQLLAIFAATAALLAAIGIYGVMSFTISKRTREIGVRMALGADRRDVLRLVVGQGMSVALAGAGAGLAGALLLTRLMRGLLYGVGPSDPVTYAAVALLLLAIALAASYLPARRASRIDPISALRRE